MTVCFIVSIAVCVQGVIEYRRSRYRGGRTVERSREKQPVKRQSGESLEPVDLPRLLGEVQAGVLEIARGKGLHLEIHVEAGAPRSVLAPARLLASLLNAIVGASVEATSNGFVEITLHAPTPRARWLVSFRDSRSLSEFGALASELSAGASQASLSHEATGGDGTSLGVARRMARAMGGELKASALGEDSIVLSLTLDLVVIDTVAEDSGYPGGRIVAINDRFGRHRRKAGALDVLVVEDQMSSQIHITDLLRRGGYRVSAVSTGEEAMKSMRHRRFALIFVDLTLPGMQGIQLLRSAEANDGHVNTRTPMIVVTGDTAKATREACYRAGARGFLTKPVSAMQLLDVIEAILEVEFAGQDIGISLVNNEEEARQHKLGSPTARMHLRHARTYMNLMFTALEAGDWLRLRHTAEAMRGIGALLEDVILTEASQRIVEAKVEDLPFSAAGLVRKTLTALNQLAASNRDAV